MLVENSTLEVLSVEVSAEFDPLPDDLVIHRAVEKGRVSEDRRKDIIRAAKRREALAQKL